MEKIFIATPMYGGVCYGSYTTGLLDAVTKAMAEGYQVLYSAIGNESLITRGRNNLVHQFLGTDAQYFLFIDADIGFDGDDVLKLVRSGKDVICGLYPKKAVDWERVDIAASMGKKNLKDYSSAYVVNIVDDADEAEVIDGSIVEIKHGGTGFMLIKRQVFEKLAPYVKEYREWTVKNSEGEMAPLVKEFFALDIVGEDKYFLSEDYFFCELWKKHGGKIFADLSINLMHTGTYEYRGNVSIGGANTQFVQQRGEMKCGF